MKTTYLITLIAFTVILTGCATNFGSLISGSRTNAENPLPTMNTGNEGVDVAWLKDMPKDSVTRDTDFPIAVRLSNPGFADVTEGMLKVWACSAIELEGGKLTEDFALNRKDLQNLAGEMKQFFYSARAVNGHDGCYMRAQICYPYTTHLSQEICIDPEPHKPDLGKPCQHNSPVTPSTQGAPVAVDRIEYSYSELSDTEVRVRFIIYPKNVGTGQIIEEASWNLACENTGGEDVIKKLNIIGGTARLGLTPLTCTPGTITINKETELKKRQYFSCTTVVQKERGVYATILTADLRYGYIDGEEVTVNILGKKDSQFPDPKDCPESNCLSSIIPGVCEVYGGSNPDQSCTDYSMKCCRENTHDCERVESGTCKRECEPGETFLPNKCPSAMWCCK